MNLPELLLGLLGIYVMGVWAWLLKLYCSMMKTLAEELKEAKDANN